MAYVDPRLVGVEYQERVFTSDGREVVPLPLVDDAPPLVGLAPFDYGPVLTRNTANAWEAGLVEGPMVLWDPTTHRWAMLYVGYNGALTTPKIGLAWSSDLVNWKRNGSTEIFAGTGVDGDPDCTVTGPSVFYEGGVFYLYYIGCSTFGFEAGTKTMNLATATSLTGPWTRKGTPVISPSAAGSGWRSNAIWHPHVVRARGAYHMFFNASTSPVTDERIGHAKATSPGGPWVVDSSELLLHGAGGTWDAIRVNDPCVYRVGTNWYMAYGGINAAGTTFDGIAYTTDADFPYGWVKHSLNPVLSPQYGANQGGGRPFILNVGGTHFHFFTAQGSGQNCVALAMQGNTVDGPWHFSGGDPASGAHPVYLLRDKMDSAWFPAFNANWTSWDTGASNFDCVGYRIKAGGKTLEFCGIATNAAVLNLSTGANCFPFTLPLHARPLRECAPSATSFNSTGSVDAIVGYRVQTDGQIKVTVGPTSIGSGYFLGGVTVPLR